MRKEENVEDALKAKSESSGGKDKKFMEKYNSSKFSNVNKGASSPCTHCKKSNHHPKKCWWRPDIKCRKCGIMGHMEKVCKSQQSEVAKAHIEENDEEQLFVATCFAAKNNSSDSWLIDSGCTNHMTNDPTRFIEINKTFISKVRIGNGQLILVKGKGTVEIESLTCLKHISDVLYVPYIDQNLLSVGQLLEKGYKAFFEDK